MSPETKKHLQWCLTRIAGLIVLLVIVIGVASQMKDIL
jgi:hypothetical protein